MTKSVKVLFLAAAPTTAAKLELDIELRTIKEKIRTSRYTNKIEVVSEWAVRDDDLLFHMNNNHPNIVHFSGHGTSTGELIFEGPNRSSKPISQRAIKALFQNFKRYTNLVILNACNTEAQAKAIAEDIDCVIGTNQAIGDKAAIGFISSFYGALSVGNSVEAAFQQGITQLLIKNIPEEHIPQLFTRPGIDASRITLKELAI
jgi:CHAT domain-containing protein